MATVIPFPAERLGDPADALFLALMRSDGSRVRFGEVIELPGLSWAAEEAGTGAGEGSGSFLKKRTKKLFPA